MAGAARPAHRPGGLAGREPGPAATTGRPPAAAAEAETALAGPGLLGLAVPAVGRLALGVAPGETGNRAPLAPPGLPALLALEVRRRQSRAAGDRPGGH